MAHQHSAKHKKEWREIYDRINEILKKFGKNAEAGAGDYWLADDIIDNTHVLMINKLHMLRPEVVEPLARALVGFPDWQIKIVVITTDGKTIISPERGLVVDSDGVIDILDRTMLPAEYRGLRYSGARRPITKNKQ